MYTGVFQKQKNIVDNKRVNPRRYYVWIAQISIFRFLSRKMTDWGHFLDIQRIYKEEMSHVPFLMLFSGIPHLAMFGAPLAIWQGPPNMAKWGIPEKSIKDAAQKHSAGPLLHPLKISAVLHASLMPLLT